MTTIFHNILWPVAFSDNPMAALDQVARLARKSDALLCLMHVEFVPMRDWPNLRHRGNDVCEPNHKEIVLGH